MYSRILYFCIFILLYCISLEANQRILIIGAGPAGLAAAIEAKQAGKDVLVVEKRDQYTRVRFVFLLEKTLDLLEKWNANIPNLVVSRDYEEKIGFSMICDIEKGLAQRAKDLGVLILRGDFEGIQEGRAILNFQGLKVLFPYDLLIGADGTHSSVRESLQIPLITYGKAIGFGASIPNETISDYVEFMSPFKFDSIMINKIVLPHMQIISGQAEGLTKQEFDNHMVRLGWVDGSILASGKVIYLENIGVDLQECKVFCDPDQKAILIGDAAATASFLQGLGANSSLAMAAVAGDFFRTAMNKDDYAAYNKAVQVIADSLVSDSAFLFGLDK